MKGEEQIKKMFRGIITLLTANEEKTLVGLKYGVDKKLKDFLDSTKGNEQSQIIHINDKPTVVIDDKFRVNLNFHEGYVEIGLLKLQKEGDLNLVHTGVYLFMSSVEKLLRYLNGRFNFEADAKKTVNIGIYEHDYFF